jgi:double-stranded uracil-DNA glycosylase
MANTPRGAFERHRLTSILGDLHVRKSGLPPVIDDDTEILILGTLPSDKSLAAGQYYANPGNDFWKLVEAALSQNLVDLPYQHRIRCLKENRIELWDAYHSCVHPGSMDSHITEQEINDFAALKGLAPKLRLVCFNGGDAAAPEGSLVRLGYQTCHLPSSSGANRKDQIGRLVRWKAALRLWQDFPWSLRPDVRF